MVDSTRKIPLTVHWLTFAQRFFFNS